MSTSTHTEFPIRLAQAVGITSSAFLSGYLASVSTSTVPALATAPDASSVAPAWEKAFNVLMATGPPIAVLASSAFSYLAYRAHAHPFRVGSPSLWQLYATAGAFSISVVPFTMLAMKPGIDRLKAKSFAAAGQPKEDDEARELVKSWGSLNAIRAALPLVGSVVGVWATLSYLE